MQHFHAVIRFIYERKFKNANLASYIARNCDKNEDGKLSAGEIKKIKKIVLPDADDSKAKTMDLRDLSKLPYIESLELSGGDDYGAMKKVKGLKNPYRLKALDLSKNKKLASLELCGMAEPSVAAIRLYGNGRNLKKLSFGHQYDREEVDLSGWNLRSLEEFECSAPQLADFRYKGSPDIKVTVNA